jgi:hypothetical protein
MIDDPGAYIETHPRHYRQQSHYTICRAKDGDRTVLMKHEAAIEANPDDHNVKKFVLLSSEKQEVLEMLFKMNINDYTLFGDEEALMRMLAYKEFHHL